MTDPIACANLAGKSQQIGFIMSNLPKGFVWVRLLGPMRVEKCVDGATYGIGVAAAGNSAGQSVDNTDPNAKRYVTMHFSEARTLVADGVAVIEDPATEPGGNQEFEIE